MKITIQNDFIVEGKKLSNPVFTLSGNSNSTLTLSNNKTVGATIKAKKGVNDIEFVDTIVKSSVVKGGNSQEFIAVEEGTKLIGKNRFRLGNGKDSVNIDGSIKTLVINNGLDKDRDKIIIKSYDLIQKKLRINNFGKTDRLVIEEDIFKYKSLNNEETKEALKELGIVVDTIGSD